MENCAPKMKFKHAAQLTTAFFFFLFNPRCWKVQKSMNNRGSYSIERVGIGTLARGKIQSMRQLRNAFVIISTNDCKIFLISQFYGALAVRTSFCVFLFSYFLEFFIGNEIKWIFEMRFTMALHSINSHGREQDGSQENEVSNRECKRDGRKKKGQDVTTMLTAAQCRVGQCYWHTFDVLSTVCIVWQWSATSQQLIEGLETDVYRVSLNVTASHPIQEDYHQPIIIIAVIIGSLSYFFLCISSCKLNCENTWAK